MATIAQEIESGTRFEFGANWARFLTILNDERIGHAEDSLKQMLGVLDLAGQRFLDAGSGSGLFSLAARRLDASVVSFDFDPKSVGCTAELRRRYYKGDREWQVETGSVLDRSFMADLGQFDVVYSWGVLHHTGNMWLAIENALQAVKPRGLLFIAIYNDQGWKSRLWWLIKATYCKLPSPLNLVFGYSIGFATKAAVALKHTLLLRPRVAWNYLFGPQGRGMSMVHDMIDWIGGFPFEVATFEVLESYLAARGFTLVKGTRADSIGCHQLVLRRDSA